MASLVALVVSAISPQVGIPPGGTGAPAVTVMGQVNGAGPAQLTTGIGNRMANVTVCPVNQSGLTDAGYDGEAPGTSLIDGAPDYFQFSTGPQWSAYDPNQLDGDEELPFAIVESPKDSHNWNSAGAGVGVTGNGGGNYTCALTLSWYVPWNAFLQNASGMVGTPATLELIQTPTFSSATATSISMTWGKFQNVAYEWLVDGYTVYRYNATSPSTAPRNFHATAWKEIGTVPQPAGAGPVAFTDNNNGTGLVAGMDYYYTIRINWEVTGSSGTHECQGWLTSAYSAAMQIAPPAEEEVLYNFASGYTMFSLQNENLTGISASDVAQAINTTYGSAVCTGVYNWTGDATGYTTFVPGVSPIGGADDFDVQCGWGYFVYCSDAVNNVPIWGKDISNESKSYALSVVGWHMMGWTNKSSTFADYYVTNVSAADTGYFVTDWNTGLQAYDNLYIDGFHAPPGFQIDPKQAVWIHVEATGTIDY